MRPRCVLRIFVNYDYWLRGSVTFATVSYPKKCVIVRVSLHVVIMWLHEAFNHFMYAHHRKDEFSSLLMINVEIILNH